MLSYADFSELKIINCNIAMKEPEPVIRIQFMIIAVYHMHRTYKQVWNQSLKKNSGLKGIRTHHLCNTGAVLYQLSYQAIWELGTLRVRNTPREVVLYNCDDPPSPQFKCMIFHISICIPN